MKKLFTSESVTCGHPDKVCDQISDAVLDAYLEKDSSARVACEVAISHKGVLIMGEITSKGNVDIEKVAREKIISIGYNSDELGFNGYTCKINLEINKQSVDIALGVDSSLETKNGEQEELGAGDQGMMFGYATNETKELMPAPIIYAHKLSKRLEEVRKKDIIPFLRPDGKTQVTFEYENGIPKYVDTIVISTQHSPETDMNELKEKIITYVINEVIDKSLLTDKTKIFINPTGRFVIGGPAGDSGLTGRKIIVDTYGGACGHGGGAFSGKDYTKVDRSASYYSRYVAKNIVASGLAKKCEIEVAYAIGVAHPVSLYINTYGTGTIGEEKLLEIINKVFDFRPSNIINSLKLDSPIYSKTSTYGHFGWDDYPWEKTDKIKEIKEAI